MQPSDTATPASPSHFWPPRPVEVVTPEMEAWRGDVPWPTLHEMPPELSLRGDLIGTITYEGRGKRAKTGRRHLCVDTADGPRTLCGRRIDDEGWGHARFDLRFLRSAIPAIATLLHRGVATTG